MTHSWREWHGGRVSRHRRRVNLTVARVRVVRFRRVDSFVVTKRRSTFTTSTTRHEVVEFVVEVSGEHVVSVGASALRLVLLLAPPVMQWRATAGAVHPENFFAATFGAKHRTLQVAKRVWSAHHDFRAEAASGRTHTRHAVHASAVRGTSPTSLASTRRSTKSIPAGITHSARADRTAARVHSTTRVHSTRSAHDCVRLRCD